jgi:signal transduction histidine kinase
LGPVARGGAVSLEGPNGSDAELEGDRELLRRVCINLVSNALKFTPEGGRVLIEIEDRDGSLLASVFDTGPGIAPEDREKIFDKFYRAPGAGGAPQRVPGSGLGLAIAKRAVDLHHGRLWVEKTGGWGSVFHVLLPKSQTHNPKGAA